MYEGLLTTKLHVPRPRADLIARPRLSDQLRNGTRRRLTLVSAPAGSGKTTAVSAWVHGSDMPAAWLSLDSGDNDPSRFWSYFIAALQMLESRLGESAGPLLRSLQPLSHEALLTVLINDVAAFGDEFAVVLEDYHTIDAAAVHEGVEFLLDHLPPQMHLVIITRADPSLPLARLRAGNDLVELRAADLRFTQDETFAYLQRTMQLDLSSTDVEALESYTEGWIVGLQMAALSLRGHEDVAGFIDSLSGSHRYILDYLTEEVLDHQPERVRSFLVETSNLSRLSGPLCDAVTGRTGSREMLETLERSNLFVTPLDDERRWFRYHPLFADFLRRFLQDVEPNRVSDLHQRASEWFADNAFAGEAVDHALAARDFDRAALLLERYAQAMVWRDAQHKTVLTWMDSLPDDVVRSRPQLCLLHAWARFITGQWGTVEPLLERAERAIGETEGNDGHEILGETAVIRSCIAYESGNMDQSIALTRRSLTLLPESAQSVRAMASFQLGLGSFFVGELSEALEAYREATAISRVTGNVTIALMASGCQVQLEVVQGRLRAAAVAYEEARQLGTSKAGLLLAPTGLACVQMGEVLRERNDLEAADRTLREGIDLCRQHGGMPEIVIQGHVSLARVLEAGGDVDGSIDAMRQAEQLLAEFLSRPGDARRIVSQAMGDRVRWWLTRGDLASADQWVEQEGLSTAGKLDLTRLVDYVLLSRLLIAQRKYDEALSVLDRLGPLTAEQWQGRLSEICALQALAMQAQENHDRAGELVGQALAVAESDGYVRLFLDEGEPMRRLLQHAVSEGISSEYAARLLAAFRDEGASASGDILEPLSDREMAILRLMSAGLSNNDIADELYLSINTVKWHARNIFGKLGVNNRSKAAVRARELSLL